MKTLAIPLAAVGVLTLIAIGEPSAPGAMASQKPIAKADQVPAKPLILGQAGTVVVPLGFSADSKTMAYGLIPNSDRVDKFIGRVAVWDLFAAKEVQRFDIGVRGGDLSPDGKTLILLVASYIGAPRIELWDVATGKKIRDFDNKPQPGYPTVLKFLPDGKTVVSYIWGGPLHLWDPVTGKVIGSLAGSRRIIQFFAISEDGKHILAAHNESHWVDFDPIIHKGLQPGRKMQVAINQGSVCLWNIATGKEVVVGIGKGPVNLKPPRGRGTWGVFSSSRGAADHGFRAHISPDGLVLFTPPMDKFPLEVQLNSDKEQYWVLDYLSGDKLQELKSPDENVFEWVGFSPDGRTLVATTFDRGQKNGSRAVVLDMSDLLEKERRRVAKLTPKELDALWEDLAIPNDRKIHIAMFSLSLLPSKDFVAFFEKKIPTITPADLKRIPGWLADLDSKTFAVREKALAELEKLGKEVEPALREALKADLPLEPATRIKLILEKVKAFPVGGETARALRVLDLLEHNRSPEARKLLELLARGPANAWVTEEAKISLVRLGK